MLSILAVFALLASVFPLQAQNVNPAEVVTACNTPPSPYPTTGRAALTVDVNGNICVTGSFSAAAPADTVGATVAMNASTATATVALAGQNGAEVFIAAGTLSAGVIAEASNDGGTTWYQVNFINSQTGAYQGSISLTNPNAAISRAIAFVGPLTHVRISLGTYTSGSANATLRATWTRPFSVLYGIDGAGGIRPVNVNTSGQISTYAFLVDSVGNTVSSDGASLSVNVANTHSVTITNTSDTVVKPGDAVNNAIRTNCVTGCSGAASANFNAAFPSSGSAIGFKDPLGNMVAANADYYGNQLVRIASLDPTAVNLFRNAVTGVGQHILGTFNRPLSSTGDALDVNIKYPPAVNDPCQQRKGFVAISQAASAQIVTATPGMTTFICGIFVDGADAENVSLVYGTGTTCGTGTTAMIGGTTAATGPNMAANGGFVQGFANSSIATAPPGQNVCLQQSGSGRVAGNLTLVISP